MADAEASTSVLHSQHAHHDSADDSGSDYHISDASDSGHASLETVTSSGQSLILALLPSRRYHPSFDPVSGAPSQASRTPTFSAAALSSSTYSSLAARRARLRRQRAGAEGAQRPRRLRGTSVTSSCVEVAGQSARPGPRRSSSHPISSSLCLFSASLFHSLSASSWAPFFAFVF